MGLVKTSITIPDDLFNQAKEMSDNFSSVVTKALKEYLRIERVKKAANSFGKWEDREKDSVHIVNELRREDSRDYANRSH